MRFTLQHVLAFHGACLLLVAANVVLTGGIGAVEGILILLICASGGAWGLWRHGREPLPPLRPFVLGMLKAVLISLLIGLLLGVNRAEICTRTLYDAREFYLGVLRWRVSGPTDRSRVIEQDLKCVTLDRHWVPVNAGLWVVHGDSMPQFRYPLLRWHAQDLRLLAHLEPVEKCHAMFQWDNPIDLQMASLRERIHVELEWRLGRYGGERRPGTDADIVRSWWQEFEPILRPMKKPEDFQKAVDDFRRRNTSRSDWDLMVVQLAQRFGLPLPAPGSGPGGPP